MIDLVRPSTPARLAAASACQVLIAVEYAGEGLTISRGVLGCASRWSFVVAARLTYLAD
jgi:hypothetical protein